LRKIIIPTSVRGTLMQSASVAILLTSEFLCLPTAFQTQPDSCNRAMATAVLVTVLTMVVYNILAVVVLQGSNHSTKGSDRRQLARSTATNPTITSSQWLAATD
jgi:hypothetical protein